MNIISFNQALTSAETPIRRRWFNVQVTRLTIELKSIKMSDNESDSGSSTPSYRKQLNCIKNILALKTKALMNRHQDFHELECRFQTYFQKLYDQRREIILGNQPIELRKSLNPANPVNPVNPVPYVGPVYQPNQPTPGFVQPATSLIPGQPPNPTTPQITTQPAEPTVQEPSYPEPDGIPKFWLRALQHEGTTAGIIRKHDEDVLKYLMDIKCVMIEKPASYVLEFHFMPNGYFEDTVLTKYYKMRSQMDPDDPFVYQENVVYESKGCPIQWRPGKNVMLQVRQKKNGNRTIKRIASFFQFFDPPRLTKRASAVQRRHIKERLELDYQIGEIIRTDIIPRAVLYYTDEMYQPEDDTEEEEDEE